MLTALNKFTAALVLVLSTLYSPSVWSKDCVTCGIRPDPTGAFKVKSVLNIHSGMSGIKCRESSSKYTFEEDFCMAYSNVLGQDDANEWVDRCKHTDPKGRESLLELLGSVECSSDKIKTTALKHPEAGITNNVIPAGTFLIYESHKIVEITDFYRNIMKHYRDIGKERGYPELKEFVGVLNKPDTNEMTFLDNILTRWDDEFAEESLFTNQRNRLISNLCKVGAKFSSESNMRAHKCNSSSKYVE